MSVSELVRLVVACAVALVVAGCGARTELPSPGADTADVPACANGESRPCYAGPPGTAGIGACREGTTTCVDGRFGACAAEVLPRIDDCNGVDDDCDGTVDDAGCLAPNGCADGTREGFVDAEVAPDIAGCAGGFDVPGVLGDLAPACDRQAGNDSPSPGGAGCGVEDLCRAGWHVCSSEADVAARAPGGCGGITSEPGLFFVTKQSSPGCGICAMGGATSEACSSCQCVEGCLQTSLTANDVFGCGTIGDVTTACGVLDRFSNDLCSLLPAPWACGTDGCSEAHALVKPGPGGGGALCCRD